MSYYVETTISDIIFKVIFLGDTCSGKTAILNNYVKNYFPINFSSTIGIDFFIKTITFNDINYKLHIWDTAGQEKFSAIIRSYYKGAALAVIVYDVTNRTSFLSIKNWIDLFYTFSSFNKPVIIVGNKIDLKQRRSVSYEEGKELSEKCDAKYIEVSAKDSVNIDKLFEIIIESINTTLVDSPHSMYYNQNLDGISIYNKKILRNINSLRIRDPPNEEKKNKCCTIL